MHIPKTNNLGIWENLSQEVALPSPLPTRRYRYTFQPGGFYRSLKRRAEPVLREIGTGPDWRAR